MNAGKWWLSFSHQVNVYVYSSTLPYVKPSASHLGKGTLTNCLCFSLLGKLLTSHLWDPDVPFVETWELLFVVLFPSQHATVYRTRGRILAWNIILFWSALHIGTILNMKYVGDFFCLTWRFLNFKKNLLKIHFDIFVLFIKSLLISLKMFPLARGRSLGFTISRGTRTFSCTVARGHCISVLWTPQLHYCFPFLP